MLRAVTTIDSDLYTLAARVCPLAVCSGAASRVEVVVVSDGILLFHVFVVVVVIANAGITRTNFNSR